MVAAALAFAALAASPAAQLTPAQLAGQRVVFSFEGPRAPAALVRRIRRGEAAGVILFARNIPGRAALRREVRRLQRIPRPAAVDAPLLVMVDEEGGLVRRIPGAPRASAADIGRSRSPRRARAAGRATGTALRRAGVNVDLAPVADVARPGSAMERERRSFGRDPRLVARLAGAFAAGLRDRGVAATAKHYPGFGAAELNTDLRPQRIHRTERVLARVDERPFRALIARGVELVMLSTAVYPALDSRPAALSRRIADTRLRERLGFRGVSISDALDTPATARLGGTGEVALRAARAGTDLLVHAGGYRHGARAAVALARGLRGGRLRRSRFEDSVNRTLVLRSELPR